MSDFSPDKQQIIEFPKPKSKSKSVQPSPKKKHSKKPKARLDKFDDNQTQKLKKVPQLRKSQDQLILEKLSDKDKNKRQNEQKFLVRENGMFKLLKQPKKNAVQEERKIKTLREQNDKQKHISKAYVENTSQEVQGNQKVIDINKFYNKEDLNLPEIKTLLPNKALYFPNNSVNISYVKSEKSFSQSPTNTSNLKFTRQNNQNNKAQSVSQKSINNINNDDSILQDPKMKASNSSKQSRFFTIQDMAQGGYQIKKQDVLLKLVKQHKDSMQKLQKFEQSAHYSHHIHQTLKLANKLPQNKFNSKLQECSPYLHKHERRIIDNKYGVRELPQTFFPNQNTEGPHNLSITYQPPSSVKYENPTFQQWHDHYKISYQQQYRLPPQLKRNQTLKTLKSQALNQKSQSPDQSMCIKSNSQLMDQSSKQQILNSPTKTVKTEQV